MLLKHFLLVSLLPSLFLDELLATHHHEVHHFCLEGKAMVELRWSPKGQMLSEAISNLIGQIYLNRCELVWKRNTVLFLEVDGLVSGAIAIGYEMDEGVEN